MQFSITDICIAKKLLFTTSISMYSAVTDSDIFWGRKVCHVKLTLNNQTSIISSWKEIKKLKGYNHESIEKGELLLHFWKPEIIVGRLPPLKNLSLVSRLK